MTLNAPDEAVPASDVQADIITFLSAPAAHGGAPVERIDTHLSHVFLAGAHAYKIKRALRYDFVDFSTPDLRRRACENEVRINRRTAPGMYLGVVPIYRNAGGPGWRGDGEPAEWAVEMKRFEADQQFDRLAARGALTDSLATSLADILAQFHLEAERRVSANGAANLERVIDQLASSLAEEAQGAREKEQIAIWARLARAELERWRGLLDARSRHGCVRRCHGDLHLANICLLDGVPAPFDAIEFSEDLADIDILYDIAFLTMDLVRYGEHGRANLVLNRYLSLTRDYCGYGLLPLMQSLRAAVRAMVLVLPGQPGKAAEGAPDYRDLAVEFLEKRDSPRLIAIGGFSGSGKSTLAAALALQFNAPAGAVLLQTDLIRKRLLGAPLNVRLDETAYGEAGRNAVYRRMLHDARRALASGNPVILDATFLDPRTRRAVLHVARAANVQFDGLWLSAPREILMERIHARTGAISDATVNVLERQLAKSRPPTDWHVVDAGREPAQSLAESARLLALGA